MKNTIDKLKNMNNVNIVLVTSNPETAKLEYYENIPIYYIPGIPFFVYPEQYIINIFAAPYTLCKLAYIYIKHKINVVHMTGPDAGLVLFLIMKLFMKKHVISSSYHIDTMEYMEKHKINYKLLTGIVKYYHYFYKFPDIILFTSQSMAEYFIANYPWISVNKIKIWPIAVNNQTFNPEFRVPLTNTEFYDNIWLSVDKIKLLYVGRVSMEKNVDHLLYIMDRLNEKHPNKFQLAIVGTGIYFDTLKNIVKDNPTITIMGLQVDKTLSEIYASADIFVFPSTSETLGFVTLESMASGTPVVVANGKGSIDIVKNKKNGYLYNDLNECIEIIELLMDPDERNNIRTNALEHIKKFSIENSTQFLYNNLNTLLKLKS